jgi:hypothetical protein
LKRCVFDIVMEKPAEVSRGNGCVWYSDGKTCWNQSAGFSMTISNTLTASTDFSRFFHHYIKHTHRLDWRWSQSRQWVCLI